MNEITPKQKPNAPKSLKKNVIKKLKQILAKNSNSPLSSDLCVLFLS
jgi:hypothetical protein